MLFISLYIRLYFHQEIAKTEVQEVKSRIIVKNMIKRK